MNPEKILGLDLILTLWEQHRACFADYGCRRCFCRVHWNIRYIIRYNIGYISSGNIWRFPNVWLRASSAKLELGPELDLIWFKNVTLLMGDPNLPPLIKNVMLLTGVPN